MRMITLLSFMFFVSIPGLAQGPAQKIYETERAFEKMVAEQGIRAAFIEFLAPDGVMFTPDAANGRETWRSRPASPAALTWNPILIDVSSGGVLAYSIGNSVYRPKGKDDPDAFAGHYISVWTRQAGGEYRAVLDTGIGHEKPVRAQTDWSSPANSGREKNERGLSAADSSTGFYQMAEADGVSKAFKSYLADDAIVMRDEWPPFFGKKAALDFLSEQSQKFKFAKRKSFIEAADLAYVYAPYTIMDKFGKTTERGNFVQVWKLRGGKWQIVADILKPVPLAAK